MQKETSIKFGANLKEFRLKKAISQGDIADTLGVSRGYISNIENGKTNPTLATISKLAEAVGVSVSDLTKNGHKVTDFASDRFVPKIEALIRAVHQAGNVIRDSFIRNEALYFKEKTNKSDIVTDIDLRSEKILSRSIQKYFPEIEIISEESFRGNFSFDQKKNIAIVDPLDGTANFFSNIPYFSISVFLNSESVGAVGIIYNPITDTLLVGNSGRFEMRQGDNMYPILQEKNTDEEVNLENVNCAVISGYDIPPEITEPFCQYLYSYGFKRVMSNWSPAHDYMNLIINKFDCVISLSEPGFSEAAGIFLVKQSCILRFSSFLVLQARLLGFHSVGHK